MFVLEACSGLPLTGVCVEGGLHYHHRRTMYHWLCPTRLVRCCECSRTICIRCKLCSTNHSSMISGSILRPGSMTTYSKKYSIPSFRDAESSFFVGLQLRLQGLKKLGLRLQPLKIPRLWLRVKVGHRLLNLCDCDSVLSERCRQTVLKI